MGTADAGANHSAALLQRYNLQARRVHGTRGFWRPHGTVRIHTTWGHERRLPVYGGGLYRVPHGRGACGRLVQAALSCRVMHIRSIAMATLRRAGAGRGADCGPGDLRQLPRAGTGGGVRWWRRSGCIDGGSRGGRGGLRCRNAWLLMHDMRRVSAGPGAGSGGCEIAPCKQQRRAA